VNVGVGAWVLTGVGVDVAAGVNLGVGVFTGVKVRVGACVFVIEGVKVGTSVFLGRGVGVNVDVAIFLTVGVTGVKVRVGARVLVKDAVGVGLMGALPGMGVAVFGSVCGPDRVGAVACTGPGVGEGENDVKVRDGAAPATEVDASSVCKAPGPDVSPGSGKNTTRPAANGSRYVYATPVMNVMMSANPIKRQPVPMRF
jgi:hypothetical protein